MILISEYGIKIKNIEAATLFEYNIGVRDHYEYTDAMFTNSLFNDFLKENGLSIYNEESTRDLICLEFNYGSRSYRQEVDHLHKIAVNANKEYKDAKLQKDDYLIQVAQNKRDKINELIETAYKNKNKYEPHSKEEIRRMFYNDGVDVEYISRKKNGDIIKRETIHYKMLFRSTGKAKKGTCMFIRDELHAMAKNFLYMGIELPEHNAKIVEISAYAPLVASGIVGRVKINPENILVLKDVDRFFKRDVVSIETDENKQCIAKHINDYTLKNTLFDGQALIDTSVFPEWASGYVLLRHHFCKMAAFHTNIQMFFKDWCEEHGENYETAEVNDMWGNPHKLKDIELVTTDNAMKWIKMGISFDYWCDWVKGNGCQFGVVKFSHESKLGQYQKMSYQMVNSLDCSIMEDVMKESKDYIARLKNDTDFFLEFLEKNKNFSNDYEVLLALCEWNSDFVRSEYFRYRKWNIIKKYVLNVKTGEIIQNADNLTIIGSPYAMLLYSVHGNEDDCDLDDTLSIENDCIQCYTERFEEGEYLAGFRSPFNGKYNMSYLHNHKDNRIKKYFNLGRQIVAVNMIGTDFQDRNNGSDQDSDFMFVTNQTQIAKHAEYCYNNYHTIVNNIPKDQNVYSSTMDDFAALDNLLAKSQLDIGESSNLAQLAQTYTCNFPDQKYEDYVCILSVLAQCAIDSAKRRFDCSITDSIQNIKKNMDIPINGYPKFWGVIKRGFNKSNIDNKLVCPMNNLVDIKVPGSKFKLDIIPMSEFVIPEYPPTKNRKQNKKVEALIEKYCIKYADSFVNGQANENYLFMRSDFDKLINDIRAVHLSGNYHQLVYFLINRAFMLTPEIRSNRNSIQTNISKNKMVLLKVLYEVNRSLFLKCFKKKDYRENLNHMKTQYL